MQVDKAPGTGQEGWAPNEREKPAYSFGSHPPGRRGKAAAFAGSASPLSRLRPMFHDMVGAQARSQAPKGQRRKEKVCLDSNTSLVYAVVMNYRPLFSRNP